MVTEVVFLEVEVDREVEVGLEVNLGLEVDLDRLEVEVYLEEGEMAVKGLSQNSMPKMKIHLESLAFSACLLEQMRMN